MQTYIYVYTYTHIHTYTGRHKYIDKYKIMHVILIGLGYVQTCTGYKFLAIIVEFCNVHLDTHL